MLVREGADRNDAIDLRLAALLAANAGALNAAAFYAVGFFSANMTGNVSALSVQLAVGHRTDAAFVGGVVAAFVGGAASAASLIDRGRRRTRRIYAVGILLEAVLLVAVGIADLRARGGWRVALVVLGLAYAMGFQNAIGTRISGARVRTTHVSGMATDIGIALASGAEGARGRRAALRLPVATLLSFLTGGIGGVVLYRAIGGFLPIGLAVLLTGIALPAMTGDRGGVSRAA